MEPAPLCVFFWGEETIKIPSTPTIHIISIVNSIKKTVWGEVAKWVVELPAWGREIPNNLYHHRAAENGPGYFAAIVQTPGGESEVATVCE